MNEVAHGTPALEATHGIPALEATHGLPALEAPPSGNAQENADALDAALAAANELSFVRLVARLERLVPHVARIGGDGPYDGEPLRFRHDPSLAFSTGDVASARRVTTARAWGEDEGRTQVEVTTTFLGLTGSASPLPLHLVEEIAQEDPESAPRRDFLDLFHHRMISLLYRGLSRFDVPATYRSDGTDEHARRLFAFAGIDAFEVPPPVELLAAVPALAGGRGTAHAVAAAVDAVFEALLESGRVRVLPFVGGADRFDDDQRMRLGVRSTTLGVDTVLGRDAPHPAGAVRVVLGPLSITSFRAFLPGGAEHARLHTVVALALDAPLDVELELVLREGERPPFALARGAALGRDTFLAGGGGRTAVRVRRPAARTSPHDAPASS